MAIQFPKFTPVKWGQNASNGISQALSGAHNLAAISNILGTQNDASASKLELSAQLQNLTKEETDAISRQLQRTRETSQLNEALADISTDVAAAVQQGKLGNTVAKLADDLRNDTTETKLTMIGNSSKATSKAKDIF